MRTRILPALVAALVSIATAGSPDQPVPEATGLLCPQPEARAFDFWLGSWDVLNRNRSPDGVEFQETGGATDLVYPVVGGCGVVEHWQGHAFSRFIDGFSVRSWDPGAREWLLVLLWPISGEPSFGELRGGFRHGRGEFSFERVGPDGEPVLTRYTFSDVAPDSLRWENATSHDGGRTWSGNWIMEFTRRPPLADGLWNGPSMTTRRCPGDEHRRFDRLLGEWAGSRADAGGESVPVTVELVSILEGCAVLERGRSPGRTWEAFRVRAFEPGAGRWVEYALDSERRRLVRREAAPGEDLVFQDVDPAGGKVTRTRWELAGEGPPRWIVEEADGPEGPWSRRAVVSLDEPLGAAP